MIAVDGGPLAQEKLYGVAGGDQAKTANDGNEYEGMIRRSSYRFSE
jgi:hypothetical protein